MIECYRDNAPETIEVHVRTWWLCSWDDETFSANSNLRALSSLSLSLSLQTLFTDSKDFEDEISGLTEQLRSAKTYYVSISWVSHKNAARVWSSFRIPWPSQAALQLVKLCDHSHDKYWPTTLAPSCVFTLTERREPPKRNIRLDEEDGGNETGRLLLHLQYIAATDFSKRTCQALFCSFQSQATKKRTRNSARTLQT